MEFFLNIIILLFLDIVLSVDNAILIASATKNLEGKSQKFAQWLGALSAVLLRLIFIIILMIALDALTKIPAIYITGGIILIWLGILIIINGDKHSEPSSSASSILKAVGIVLAGDFMMSFDNAFIIADIVNGFEKDLWVDVVSISIALLISLIVIVFFSSQLSELMNRNLWITYVAGFLLLSVGVHMMFKDQIWVELGVWEEDKKEAIWHVFVSYGIGAIITLSLVWIKDKNKEKNK